jgi:hypothetical protein
MNDAQLDKVTLHYAAMLHRPVWFDEAKRRDLRQVWTSIIGQRTVHGELIVDDFVDALDGLALSHPHLLDVTMSEIVARAVGRANGRYAKAIELVRRDPAMLLYDETERYRVMMRGAQTTFDQAFARKTLREVATRLQQQLADSGYEDANELARVDAAIDQRLAEALGWPMPVLGPTDDGIEQAVEKWKMGE